ncbi:response regulator transcription factor [Roseovarius aestuarii]|uniref:Transcriptional regulator MalT n=1 Tax=Roseovarius aestuarii TaxID=475083 RepID=A0A1X7BWS9_9RHOB|nr:LuxR C-terminal-related transcriptional regulator [Roseovarius aestuarii]SMC14097.1 transcriptional regulator MalT [Roseovarius aestuarii]
MKHDTPCASYPAITDRMIVSLIELLGRDSFAADLADILEQQFGHAHFHIFLYREKLAPAALASRPNPIAYARGLENYLNYTYVINPAYRAYRMGKPAGVYMISDFIQNDSQAILDEHDVDVHIEDSEPIGYRTPGWPKNMAEVIVLVNLPNNTVLDFSFLSPLGSRQTLDAKSSLERLFPILNAVVLRQFAVSPNSLDAENTLSGQEDRFHDFGGNVLTVREREIAQLILIGHSSNSISLNLRISLATVKSHRRNIYSKLQISSQAELFSLFLLHLK